jgi:hypothetical protein
MGDTFQAVALDLADVMKSVEFTPKLRRDLLKTLAESEGRFDMEFRKEDFGGIVRLRRVKATSAIRDWKTGRVIEAANTEGDLPVKSGRFVAGWNWKFKGTNATVESRVPYAVHAHKVDEDPGEGLKVVTRFLEKDWARAADEMADVIEDHLNGSLA